MSGSPAATFFFKVISHDPVSNRYSMRSFDNAGSTRVMIAQHEGDNWVFLGEEMRFSGVFSGDGREFSGTWQLRSAAVPTWQPWMTIRLLKRPGGGTDAHDSALQPNESAPGNRSSSPELVRLSADRSGDKAAHQETPDPDRPEPASIRRRAPTRAHPSPQDDHGCWRDDAVRYSSHSAALKFRSAGHQWTFCLAEEADVVDDDLSGMSREQLVAEVQKLRQGIRKHRDSSGQELCWHHPELWSLLPSGTDPLPSVPAWPEFLRGCVRYREPLDTQAPQAPRTTEE